MTAPRSVVWLWHRVLIVFALLIVASVGSLPAWIINRFLPLPSLVYAVVAIAGILAALVIVNFNGFVKRVMQREEAKKA
jgi:hypothetical protein